MFKELHCRKKYLFEVYERHICLGCNDILSFPMQTECGCRYCSRCIPHECLLCQVKIENARDDKAIEKEINLLPMKCINDGCEVIDTVLGMESHIKVCTLKCRFCILNENEISKLKSEMVAIKARFNDEFEKKNDQIDKLEKELVMLRIISKRNNTEPAYDQPRPYVMNISPVNNQITSPITHYTRIRNGALVMNILKIRDQIKSAQNGGPSSIISEPSYLHEPGYRFMIKVILNGDGNDRYKFLSVYFIICKGEYDHAMIWPFTQKLSFTVRSQAKYAKDINIIFKPDTNKSAYEKPASLTNISMGTPRFIKLQTIMDNDIYLVGDQLEISFAINE